MKNSAEKSNHEKRDHAIGRALANAINQEGDDAVCPSEEEMAALVEKRLPEVDRQRIMGHIARCERCLNYFVLNSQRPQTAEDNTATVASRQVSRMNRRPRPRRRMAAMGAVAAALVFTFMLPWQKAVEVGRISRGSMNSISTGSLAQVEEQSPEASQPPNDYLAQVKQQIQMDPRPATDHLAQLERQIRGNSRSSSDYLAQVERPALEGSWTSAESSAQQDWMQESEPTVPSATGWSDDATNPLSPQATAFRIGAAAIDLMAASKLPNPSRQSVALERLTSLLGTQLSESALEAFPEDEAPSTEELRQLLAHLTQQAKSNGQLSAFLLGVWVQTGLLSSDEHLPNVIHLDALAQWSNPQESQELPPSVRDVLTSLHSLLAQGNPLSTSDIDQVRGLLDELSTLF